MHKIDRPTQADRIPFRAGQSAALGRSTTLSPAAAGSYRNKRLSLRSLSGRRFRLPTTVTIHCRCPLSLRFAMPLSSPNRSSPASRPQAVRHPRYSEIPNEPSPRNGHYSAPDRRRMKRDCGAYLFVYLSIAIKLAGLRNGMVNEASGASFLICRTKAHTNEKRLRRIRIT